MRTRIKAVIFLSPESQPGSGVNGSATVMFEESETLRLEFDDVGVVATLLAKDGSAAKVGFNPTRYPWAVVRKVTGEPIVPMVTAKGPAAKVATS